MTRTSFSKIPRQSSNRDASPNTRLADDFVTNRTAKTRARAPHRSAFPPAAMLPIVT